MKKNSEPLTQDFISKEVGKIYPDCLLKGKCVIPHGKAILVAHTSCVIPFAGEIRGILHYYDKDFRRLDGIEFDTLNYGLYLPPSEEGNTFTLTSLGERGRRCRLGVISLINADILPRIAYTRCSYQALLPAGNIITDAELCHTNFLDAPAASQFYDFSFHMGDLSSPYAGFLQADALKGCSSVILFRQERSGFEMPRDQLDVVQLLHNKNKKAGIAAPVEDLYYKHCVDSLHTWVSFKVSPDPLTDIARLRIRAIDIPQMKEEPCRF